jgi:hypothetical protein
MRETTGGNAPEVAKVAAFSQVACGWSAACVVPCGIAAEVLKQAPDPEPPFFRVPKVIER